MSDGARRGIRLVWVDPLRALALLAILLNHLVEEFGRGPWFTNPTNGWPDLATRLATFFPTGDPWPVAAVRFLGWLGDAAPGVFILLSGLGLALATRAETESRPMAAAFYRRRLLRLFPLYVASHVVVLGLALLVPGNALTFASGRTLASLLGLRATPDLFFYISPSWWFVWLILQLYAVFPLLDRLLRRLGPARFLGLALAFTVASRGWGILRSDHLYYWMTGLFFGTRLAEFAAGMALAAWLAPVSGEPPGERRTLPPLRWIAPRAALCYVAGLAASTTLAGSLVGNFLVTLGMTGLFYAAWEGLLRRRPTMAAGLTWLGVQSYAVFLIHQPPLRWTRVWAGAHPPVHFAAAVAILALSIPGAWLMDRAVARLIAEARGVRGVRWARALGLVASLGLVAALVIVEPRVEADWKRNVLAYLVALGAGVLLWVELRAASHAEPRSFTERVLARTALLAGLAALLLPPHYADVALAGGLAGALGTGLVETRLRTARAWPVGLAAGALAALTCEGALARFAPLETRDWGERPALTTHPTRAYGLIPSRTTHLRYNDYDYVVHTNSYGLQSPEIPAARPTPQTLRVLVMGDAFSMPEGLPYEQAFPARLERRLADCLAPRPVQVINAGVTGYGPAEELPQLRELLPVFRPDVVVYEFFINEYAEQNLDAAARRRSIGLDDRGSRRERLLAASQTVARVRQIEDALSERLTGRPAAWRYRKALLDYYRAGPGPLYAPANVSHLGGLLAAMRDTVRASGADFRLYFVPGAVAVEDPRTLAYFPAGERLDDTTRYDLARPWRTLAPLCTALDVACADLTPVLHAARPTYFPTSWHWNAAGHAAVADALAGDILSSLSPLRRAPACTARALATAPATAPTLARAPSAASDRTRE